MGKILILPGEKGRIVYFKAVGKRVDGTTVESDLFSFSVRGPEPVGNPAIAPVKKNSAPVLTWQNNCNTKFKVWFGSDNRFTRKTAITYEIKKPSDQGGESSKTLTSGQWMAIKRLTANVSGSTLYWYVESWDTLGRHNKTEVTNFSLTD